MSRCNIMSLHKNMAMSRRIIKSRAMINAGVCDASQDEDVTGVRHGSLKVHQYRPNDMTL